MQSDKVAVIIRNPKNYWEGLRSSIGMGLEMIETDIFVLGQVDMPEDLVEGYKQNLEFHQEELECHLYTDTQTNVDKWEFFAYMPLKDMAEKITEYDLVLPF